MASQKQAKRRNAVSSKQRASHGNNRGRSSTSYDPAAAQVSAAPRARGAGPGLGQAIFRPKTKDWTGTAVAAGGAASAIDLALDPEAPLPSRMVGWMRDHPLHFAVWVISTLALAVSIYLTITHYDSGVTLVCSGGKGLVNCAKVTTSSQSMVFGVFPVAVLGLAFYCFMFLINSPWGWKINRPQVRRLRLGSAVVGMGFVLYLIYAEVIQIGNICLWCTGVHILTFLMFVLLVYDATTWNSSTLPTRRS